MFKVCSNLKTVTFVPFRPWVAEKRKGEGRWSGEGEKEKERKNLQFLPAASEAGQGIKSSIVSRAKTCSDLGWPAGAAS